MVSRLHKTLCKLKIQQDEEKKASAAAVDDSDVILPPSTLSSRVNSKHQELRKHSVTTDDLLQHTSIYNSKDDKIYGFYYLVS
jgi:hypothetical protein